MFLGGYLLRLENASLLLKRKPEDEINPRPTKKVKVAEHQQPNIVVVAQNNINPLKRTADTELPGGETEIPQTKRIKTNELENPEQDQQEDETPIFDDDSESRGRKRSAEASDEEPPKKKIKSRQGKATPSSFPSVYLNLPSLSSIPNTA